MKNDIEKPQAQEKNANKNTDQVKGEALDHRNHGNTKEERSRKS